MMQQNIKKAKNYKTKHDKTKIKVGTRSVSGITSLRDLFM